MAVVVVHCLPPPDGLHQNIVFESLNHATRFAVPFFFMVSGFFIEKPNQTDIEALKKLFLRLFPIFIVWLAVYEIYAFLVAETLPVIYPGYIAHMLLTGGENAAHLWFLPSLGMCMGLLIIGKKLPDFVLISIALSFYLFVLAFVPYREILGLERLPYFSGFEFKSRFGPFFGFVFVLMGYLISKYSIRLNCVKSIVVSGGGLALMMAEQHYIWTIDPTMNEFDAYVGTVIFGFGVFLFALNIKENMFSRTMATIGKVSLGVYCIHILFKRFLTGYWDFESYELIVLIVLVMAFSILSSFLASKIPKLRLLFV